MMKQEWFNALPFLTRYWFGLTVVVTLSVNFGILSGYLIVWNWDMLKSQFQFWRILTPYCYAGPFDFDTLIAVYMLVQFSKQYEAGGPFDTGAGSGTADYAFCLLFGMVSILVSYPFVLIYFKLAPVFCTNLIYYVLYVWSKRNPTAPGNIWGFPIPGIYMPFACLAFRVFVGKPYMDMIHGMVIAHLYYFLVDVIPLVYGKDFLRTPQFLIDYFGVGEYRPELQQQQQPQRNNNRGGFGGSGPVGGGTNNRATGGGGGGSHNWGSGGQTLGRN